MKSDQKSDQNQTRKRRERVDNEQGGRIMNPNHLHTRPPPGHLELHTINRTPAQPHQPSTPAAQPIAHQHNVSRRSIALLTKSAFFSAPGDKRLALLITATPTPRCTAGQRGWSLGVPCSRSPGTRRKLTAWAYRGGGHAHVWGVISSGPQTKATSCLPHQAQPA